MSNGKPRSHGSCLEAAKARCFPAETLAGGFLHVGPAEKVMCHPKSIPAAQPLVLEASAEPAELTLAIEAF